MAHYTHEVRLICTLPIQRRYHEEEKLDYKRFCTSGTWRAAHAWLLRHRLRHKPRKAPVLLLSLTALVDTEWILAHANDPGVRLLDVRSKQEGYDEGHLPGAIYVNPSEKLTNPGDATRGQILTEDALSEVLSAIGVTNDDTIVLYDDISNLWAARAYWALKYYQHDDVRIYNGGIKKWLADGQELTTETPVLFPSTYIANEANPDIRTTTEYVLAHLDDDNVVLCDTRNPEEHAGTDVRSSRGGHVPGSINVEWIHSVNEDGTFRDTSSLEELYTKAGFARDKQIVTYCQTGVRGAHTWFVLSQLLGYPDVRNYDGSWEEYGNSDGTPIES